MTLLGDSSILVEDKNSTDAVYRIEADAPVGGITGFRIEALKDASLPMMGPGLQNSNGNFCLTELTVRVGGGSDAARRHAPFRARGRSRTLGPRAARS